MQAMYSGSVVGWSFGLGSGLGSSIHSCSQAMYSVSAFEAPAGSLSGGSRNRSGCFIFGAPGFSRDFLFGEEVFRGVFKRSWLYVCVLIGYSVVWMCRGSSFRESVRMVTLLHRGLMIVPISAMPFIPISIRRCLLRLVRESKFRQTEFF